MGGDSNGVPFHVWAFEEWRESHGFDPPWGKVEYIKLATAFKRFAHPDYARAAWTAFLADSDPYSEGHPPGLFLSQLAKWQVKANKRKPREKKAETFPGAERAAKMVAILKEVEADDTIPATMKRDEMAKRWKGIQA